jgi:hypothetical protein
MQNQTKILIIIISLLAVSNIFFLYQYRVSQRALNQIITQQQINAEILSFTELFMTKVLQGAKEVSFEDRLQLENAVRALNDQAIITAWQTFTKAKDSAEIQQDFYALFALLLKKIQF